MSFPTSIPAVWVHTATASYNEPRAGYVAFLDRRQQARLERIRQARMLFDGEHRAYYLGERRTQFDFPVVRVGGAVVQPYETVNAITLVCCKVADLLFGVEPRVDVEGEAQAKHLAELRDRSAVDRLFYNTCLECTYEAEGFLEAVVAGGQVYLASIPADEIFPAGELGPDDQYRRYVRYRLRNVGTPEKAIWLRLSTTYAPGRIEHALHQLGDDGLPLKEVGLELWVVGEGEPPLAPSVPTGIDVNTVTWCYNELARKRPVSLVDRLIPLQDSLNAKQTQIDRVLAKHSDPKLWLHRKAADPEGNVRADHDAFYGDDKAVDKPEYILWEASLEAAQKSKSEALALLCLTAEVSPALLGLKEGAAPDAARKLRLEATNTLAMVQRLASNWKPAIRRALTVAQALEQTIPGTRYDRGPISVKTRDGLPIDTLDQAQEISLLMGAGAMSPERAVGLQIEDKAEADAEIARLAAVRAAATPPILLGAGGAAGGEEPGANPAAPAVGAAGGGDNQAEAVQGNELRETVGALDSIQDLQEKFYGKKLPREACIANLKLMLGFTTAQAAEFFPDVAPDAPGPDPVPAKAPAVRIGGAA